MSKGLFIKILFFAIIVAFTHLPFFLQIPIPFFAMDTYGYFWVAYEIAHNNLPLVFEVMEFPLGYSIILYGCNKIGLNLVGVLGVQTISYFLAGSYLIYGFSKIKSSLGWAAAFSVIIYTIAPSTINQNLSLYTESFYSSTLIFLAGALAIYYHKKNNLSFALVLLGVFLGITFRSNGLVLLPIPFVILFLERKEITDLPKKLLLFVLVVVIPQLAINGFFKHELSFSESNRIKKVFQKLIGSYEKNLSEKQIKQYEDKKPPKTEMYKDYFANFVAPNPSFYFSKLTTFYEKEVIEKRHQNPNQTMFDAKIVIEDYRPELKNYMLGNYDYANFESISYQQLIDYNSPHKSKWMSGVHLSYEILNKTKAFYLIYIVFWLGLIYSIYTSFKNKQLNWLLYLVVYIHLVSLFILPLIHGRVQARYIAVSEFIVILLFAIFVAESRWANKIVQTITNKLNASK